MLLLKEMTTKQTIVVGGMVANGGIDGKLLAQAGYSEAIQHNPHKVLKSQAIQELIKEQLPLQEAFKVHREAFKATRWNDFTGEREEDHAIRLRAATEAYKVHGVGAVTTNGVSNTQINISFDGNGYIPPDNVLNLKPTLKSKR